jgi:hypothetical protein
MVVGGTRIDDRATKDVTGLCPHLRCEVPNVPAWDNGNTTVSTQGGRTDLAGDLRGPWPESPASLIYRGHPGRPSRIVPVV